ncbi:MAG: sulfite reductase flavoprotein subunit alpha [Mycobacterium sp.]
MPDRAALSLTVGFGSETGGAESLAGLFTAAAKTIGIEATAVELNAVGRAELAAATHLVVITATYGEGEFPFNASLFWELLEAEDAERLDHLTFAVLGLGDKYYPQFSNAGKLTDERLAELGATRMTARVDCDIDFDDDAAAWTADVIALLSAAVAPEGRAPVGEDSDDHHEHPVWHRKNPFSAELRTRRLLTGPGSDDEVWHYEIDLADSGLIYQAGDSLGVHPVNDPALVDALLARLGRAPGDTVPGRELPLGPLLSEHFEIRTPSRPLQALVAARTTDAEAAAALSSADPATLDAWLYGRDLLDLLDLPGLTDLSADEVLETLRPLQYRDYSIASSPVAHPDRVHLTVATVRYHRPDRPRAGVASAHLADRAQTVRIHLQPNNAFRLPPPQVPIIMIGPGTGVAPFRAFLQERAATGAGGKSWLFFGHRRRATDFLYEHELQGYLDSGVLSRMNLAFSRDGDGRTYVQHHLVAHAAEVFTWLEDGAHLYVCGDEKRMAKDVHAALHQVVSTAGGMDDDAAHAYLNELTKHHRYARDVY